MNDPQQRSLSLHLGMSLLRRVHLARLLGLAFGLPLIALAVVAYWGLANGAWDREGSDLLGLLWKTITQDPDLKLMLWALVLLGPVGIVSIASQRQAYLQITSLGLEGYIPRWSGLGFSRQTTGRWRVPWEAIRAVHLVQHGQRAPTCPKARRLPLGARHGSRRNLAGPVFMGRPTGPRSPSRLERGLRLRQVRPRGRAGTGTAHGRPAGARSGSGMAQPNPVVGEHRL